MSKTKKKASGNDKRAASASAMDVDSTANANTESDSGWTMQVVPGAATPATTSDAANDAAADHASSILRSKHATGVTKSQPKKKSKQLRHGQLARREKGVERAEAVREQLTQKVGQSKGRARKVKDRRRDWTEVNYAGDVQTADAAVRAEKDARKKERKERKRLVRLGGAREGAAATSAAAAAAGPESPGAMVDASFVTARETLDSDADDDDDDDDDEVL